MVVPANAVEHFELEQQGTRRQVSGQLVVTAQDGGILLLAADGRLWSAQPGEIIRRSRDDSPFVPLTRDAMAQAVRTELGEGFEIHTTANYVVCHNTSKAYAQWCAALYERLHRTFHAYWKAKGFKLRAAEMPLLVIVFNSKAAYVRYAEAEIGKAASSIFGYYSLQTNRVVMYDLTGLEGLAAAPISASATNASRINQVLMQPQAANMVATIIHEATHQLAFNSGLQNRYSDVPLWLSEGLAMYFETPDLSSAKGWQSIGAVNTPRLVQFRQYLAKRPADSLLTLQSNDKRFQSSETGLDAYAESWALTYYLSRRHPEKFTQYLEVMSRRPPLVYDTPEERVARFKSVFGDDLQALDADFLQTMRKLK